VIDVAILSIIRRWHLRDQIPLREIARRLGISRNTVRRYLRADVTAPAYPARQSPSKLDGHAAKLSAWLKTEASKPRKQRRTLKQIHVDLCALGFTGSYDRVAAFARRWRQEQQEQARTSGHGTFIPLRFAEGEAFQFDWSEDWAIIAGERTKLQVAQFKLSHSRAFFLRAYLLQTHEMLFDAHHHAFVAWGGIPRRGIYDNMKTAVDRVRQGKLRDVNLRFSTMVSHYLFDAEFCNPASGWEKGQIEKNVQDSRHRIWQRIPAFGSLVALNDWLGEFYVQMPSMRGGADSTELQTLADWSLASLQLPLKTKLHSPGTTASSTRLGQLSKFQCNVLGTQMGVPLQHLHCLVPGDGGDFHDVQSAFNQPADCFMAQVMEVQVVQSLSGHKTNERVLDAVGAESLKHPFRVLGKTTHDFDGTSR